MKTKVKRDKRHYNNEVKKLQKLKNSESELEFIKRHRESKLRETYKNIKRGRQRDEK